jgi:hypothetical protein
MLLSSRGTITSVAFLCTTLVSSSVVAQTRDPGKLVAAYVREHQSDQGRSAAFYHLVRILTHHADYPPADLEKLLGGLEQVALTGEPQRLRAEAALALAIPGKRGSVHPIGTFPRLERVYRRSTDPLVRSALVGAMGDLAERREAALFLERIAKQEPADFSDSQKRALTSLLKLDDEGRTVLKRLHETNAVRNPEAKLTLAYLAKKGYRSR